MPLERRRRSLLKRRLPRLITGGVPGDNQPSRSAVEYVNIIGSCLPNLFERRLHFKRYTLTLENDVGLVQVELLSLGGHQITFTIRVWRPYRREMREGGQVVTVPWKAEPPLHLAQRPHRS